MNTNLIGLDGGIGGALGGSVCEAEAPSVDGADDVSVDDFPACQRGALMWAFVVNGVGFAFEHGHAEMDVSTSKALESSFLREISYVAKL